MINTIASKSMDILEEYSSWQKEYQLAYLIEYGSISSADVIYKEIFDSLAKNGFIETNEDAESYIMNEYADLYEFRKEVLLDNISDEEKLLNLSLEKELERKEQKEKELQDKKESDELHELMHNFHLQNILNDENTNVSRQRY